MRDNGKVSNKRKREPVIRDHATEDEEERREVGREVKDYSTTEDEDEEEGKEVEREVKELKDYSTTEDEDEEEEGKLKREAEEESVKVKQEPISPPPLRRRRG